MTEGCQIISPEWKYLSVNEAAAKHGNQSKDTLLGSKMCDVYPGIENTEVFKVLRQCMEQRQQRIMKNEFSYPDGSKRWFNLNIQPDPEGLFITSVDITKREQAKGGITQLFNMSMDMLCIADIRRATFIKVNPAFTKILGFSEAELLGKPF